MDIVERLHEAARNSFGNEAKLFREAADEIDRLTANLERAKDALARIACVEGHEDGFRLSAVGAYQIARDFLASLEKPNDPD